MIRNNKIKVIITSVIILLPIIFGLIFWDKLPSEMPNHWGADGKPDGYVTKAFSVFCMPLILLALHLLCLFITGMDPRNRNQNKKALGIVYWICPMISVFTSSISYSISLGWHDNTLTFLPVILGIMFMAIGNYMPKCVQNRTLGIKIRSTLESEANWNATHRLAGKVWFFGGILMLLTAFLPEKLFIPAFLVFIAVMVMIPIIYSLNFRKKEREAGAVFQMKPYTKMQRITSIICIVVAVLAMIFALVITFTGNISAEAKSDHISIKADFYVDVDIAYDHIESIELRDDVSFGQRISGIGTPRLLIGRFRNSEFGSYTLYAYTRAEKAIVITSKSGDVLVVALKNADQTESFYNSLCDGGKVK